MVMAISLIQITEYFIIKPPVHHQGAQEVSQMHGCSECRLDTDTVLLGLQQLVSGTFAIPTC